MIIIVNCVIGTRLLNGIVLWFMIIAHNTNIINHNSVLLNRISDDYPPYYIFSFVETIHNNNTMLIKYDSTLFFYYFQILNNFFNFSLLLSIQRTLMQIVKLTINDIYYHQYPVKFEIQRFNIENFSVLIIHADKRNSTVWFQINYSANSWRH